MGMQAVYRALSDPSRREILRLLREGDLTAGEVAQHFEISWPSVSRHLAVLSSAGLVEGTREGAHIRYRLTTSVLDDIVTELAELARLDRSGGTDPAVSRSRERSGDAR